MSTACLKRLLDHFIIDTVLATRTSSNTNGMTKCFVVTHLKVQLNTNVQEVSFEIIKPQYQTREYDSMNMKEHAAFWLGF
jgi:hypothetical protein